MFHFFKSEIFNFEFIRVLSTVPFGGAEVAECLDAASRIANDDPESWHQAWLEQGKLAENTSAEAMASGDRVAARDALLRASNYFRAAQYMFNDRPETPDVRVLPTFNKSVDLFKQAIQFIDADVKCLQIPYIDGRRKCPGRRQVSYVSKR